MMWCTHCITPAPSRNAELGCFLAEPRHLAEQRKSCLSYLNVDVAQGLSRMAGKTCAILYRSCRALSVLTASLKKDKGKERGPYRAQRPIRLKVDFTHLRVWGMHETHGIMLHKMLHHTSHGQIPLQVKNHVPHESRQFQSALL